MNIRPDLGWRGHYGLQRVRWFKTFAIDVAQIHDDDNAVEMKIERETAD